MLMFVQPSMMISYTFYTKHEIAGSALSFELVEPDVLPFLLTGCVCPGLGLYEQFSTCSFLCFLPLLCTPTHPLFISLFSPCIKVVFYQNNFNLILQNFGWQLSASAVKCAQFQLKYWSNWGKHTECRCSLRVSLWSSCDNASFFLFLLFLSFVSTFHPISFGWCFRSLYHLIQWQNPENTCIFRMNFWD